MFTKNLIVDLINGHKALKIEGIQDKHIYPDPGKGTVSIKRFYNNFDALVEENWKTMLMPEVLRNFINTENLNDLPLPPKSKAIFRATSALFKETTALHSRFYHQIAPFMARKEHKRTGTQRSLYWAYYELNRGTKIFGAVDPQKGDSGNIHGKTWQFAYYSHPTATTTKKILLTDFLLMQDLMDHARSFVADLKALGGGVADLKVHGGGDIGGEWDNLDSFNTAQVTTNPHGIYTPSYRVKAEEVPVTIGVSQIWQHLEFSTHLRGQQGLEHVLPRRLVLDPLQFGLMHGQDDGYTVDRAIGEAERALFALSVDVQTDPAGLKELFLNPSSSVHAVVGMDGLTSRLKNSPYLQQLAFYTKGLLDRMYKHDWQGRGLTFEEFLELVADPWQNPTKWKDIIADMLWIDKNGEIEVIEAHDKKMKGRSKFYILQKAIHAYVLHHPGWQSWAGVEGEGETRRRLNGMDVVPDHASRDMWYSVLTGQIDFDKVGLQFFHPITGELETWDLAAHGDILGVLGQQRPLITKGEYLLLEVINKHAAELEVEVDGVRVGVADLNKYERRGCLKAIVGFEGNFLTLVPDLRAAALNPVTHGFVEDLWKEFPGRESTDVVKQEFWEQVAARMTPYLIGGEITFNIYDELNADPDDYIKEVGSLILDFTDYYATFAAHRADFAAYLISHPHAAATGLCQLMETYYGPNYALLTRIRPLVAVSPPDD